MTTAQTAQASPPVRTPRRFRFAGAFLGAPSARAWADGARRLEDLGYDVLAAADHFGPSLLAPAPALVAAALATTRLRVACTVFDNDFRHPALLAKEAATVDLLTDGRLEVGIGAGWFKAEYDRAGLPFDPPGVRVSRLAEGVRLIKGLWTHGAGPDSPGFSFAGAHYTANELRINAPLQRPHPPLLIGGGGRRVLSLAAREADTVQIISQARPEGGAFDVATNSEAALAQRVAWVRAAAGERFPQLELSAAFHRVAITDDRLAAAERFAAAGGLTAGMTPQQILDSPYFLIGSLDAIVEHLLALRERHGISHVWVFPRDTEALAPVITRLSGR